MAVATCLISSLQDIVLELVRLLCRSEFNLSDVILSFGMDVEVIGEFFREVSERVREGDRKKGRGREEVCTM